MMRRRGQGGGDSNHDSGATLDYGYGASQQHSPMSISSGAAPPYGGYGNGDAYSHVGSGGSSRRHPKKQGSFDGSAKALVSNAKLILAVLLAFFFLTTLYYRSKYLDALTTHGASNMGLSSKVRSLEQEKSHLDEELRKLSKRARFLDEKVADLTNQNHNLKKESHQGKADHVDEMKRLSLREETLMERMEWLQYQVARESHRLVKEKFGGGPHQVSIQVELPPDRQNFPDIPANPSFVINLNPLSATPHSVWLFLEQVAHGLWDGCSFLINAHVLQAGAHPGQRRSEDKMEPFTELELDGLSFQEYNEDFPHLPYTLGFAGRPHGGPDWYINKVDNSKGHGPGGQAGAILPEEADPTFGFIDRGSLDVVKRLFALPTAPDDKDHLLRRPLHIIRATVIGWDPNARRQTIPTGDAPKESNNVTEEAKPEEKTDPADEAGPEEVTDPNNEAAPQEETE